MTSKTFKSAFEDSSYRLEVCKNAGAEHASLWILGCGSASTSIAIADKDAPALALAILEAAGWPNEYLATTEILRRLRELDEHVKAVEAEARERAELEAEALELYKAHTGYTHAKKLVEAAAPDRWLAVARRARELAKEDTK